MVSRVGSSQQDRWDIYLVVAGLIAIFVEIILAVTYWRHFPSHFQWSYNQVENLLIQSAAIVITPLPWLALREACGIIEKKILGSGADEAAVFSLQQAMSSILIFSYLPLMLCVLALSNLL
jgi:hypothetical protein